MKPWLEMWFDNGNGRVRNDNGDRIAEVYGLGASLMAAAPEMCRALLAVEWAGGREFGVDSGCDPCCPSCFEEPPCEAIGFRKGHEPNCSLDAALIKAGMSDQASRDAARKELGL